MFEMSDSDVAEWRQKCRDLVADCVEGEEVLAAAGFRQGGASVSYAASKAQLGGLLYGAVKMLRKEKAGGLPDKVMLALTPNRVRAFKLGFRGRDHKLGEGQRGHGAAACRRDDMPALVRHFVPSATGAGRFVPSRQA